MAVRQVYLAVACRRHVLGQHLHKSLEAIEEAALGIGADHHAALIDIYLIAFVAELVQIFLIDKELKAVGLRLAHQYRIEVPMAQTGGYELDNRVVLSHIAGIALGRRGEREGAALYSHFDRLRDQGIAVYCDFLATRGKQNRRDNYQTGSI